MTRLAQGDFGKDAFAETLQEWEPATASQPQTQVKAAVSLTGLFEAYIAERKPAAATTKACRRFINHLTCFGKIEVRGCLNPVHRQLRNGITYISKRTPTQNCRPVW